VNSEPSFKALFCKFLDCSPAQFEERVFRQSLYLHARLVAPLIRVLRPDFFERDFWFIRTLGETTDSPEANGTAARFRDMSRASHRPVHDGLAIRVSGRKAVKLAYQVFARERDGE